MLCRQMADPSRAWHGHRLRVTSEAATATSAGMLRRGAAASVSSHTTRAFLSCHGCALSIWPRKSWAGWHHASPMTGSRCMGTRCTSWRRSLIRSVFAGHVIRRLGDRGALIARLDRMRAISHNFGYGVGYDLDSLLVD
jgi:hypothetical protein